LVFSPKQDLQKHSVPPIGLIFFPPFGIFLPKFFVMCNVPEPCPFTSIAFWGPLFWGGLEVRFFFFDLSPHNCVCFCGVLARWDFPTVWIFPLWKKKTLGTSLSPLSFWVWVKNPHFFFPFVKHNPRVCRLVVTFAFSIPPVLGPPFREAINPMKGGCCSRWFSSFPPLPFGSHNPPGEPQLFFYG